MVFPADMEPEAKNLIDRMLELDTSARIGCGSRRCLNNIQAIKKHPFFSDIDFATLHTTKVPVPPSLMPNRVTTLKKILP